MFDSDREAWAAEQEARDAAISKQRERERRARERSARNAQRKIARLRATLEEAGEISEFEEAFAGSVAERLDRYGSAFSDPSLGRPGDALSGAQKRVVAGMNKKAKQMRRAAKAAALEGTEDAQTEEEAEDAVPPPRTGFTPRVVR